MLACLRQTRQARIACIGFNITSLWFNSASAKAQIRIGCETRSPGRQHRIYANSRCVSLDAQSLVLSNSNKLVHWKLTLGLFAAEEGEIDIFDAKKKVAHCGP